MHDEILVGGEELEVADPVASEEYESEETQEVAEPVEQEEGTRTEQDRAFAELRRRAEENERRARELEELNTRYEQALGTWFDGEDKDIQALAYAQGITEEEAREQLEAEAYFTHLEEQNALLQNQLLEVEVNNAMEQGLREIQEIDPSVKSLVELGDEFADFIASGLSSKQAYIAVKSLQELEKATTPQEIGRVNAKQVEKDYFTREEVEKMSPEEVKTHYEKIRKSQSRWR